MVIGFREYLSESSIRSVLIKEFPKETLHFLIEETPESITLNLLLVPFKKRNQGIGTKFMKRLVELADKYGKTIYLTPTDVYMEPSDMGLEKLTKWYKKFGFKENRNRNENKNLLKRISNGK